MGTSCGWPAGSHQDRANSRARAVQAEILQRVLAMLLTIPVDAGIAEEHAVRERAPASASDDRRHACRRRGTTQWQGWMRAVFPD